MNYTPTPWRFEKNHSFQDFRIFYGNEMIGVVFTEADAIRIIECVSAMEGIDDPKTHKAMWEAVKQLKLDAYYKTKQRLDNALEEIGDLKNEREKIRKQLDTSAKALGGIVYHTTADFAEKWGFGPQRNEVCEVYDRLKHDTRDEGAGK